MTKLIRKLTKLNPRQQQALSDHAEHHTDAHMKTMQAAMKNGMTFTKAHELAMKEVGK